MHAMHTMHHHFSVGSNLNHHKIEDERATKLSSRGSWPVQSNQPAIMKIDSSGLFLLLSAASGLGGAVAVPDSPTTDYVNFEVYGTTLQVADAEEPYDQNQNHDGRVAPTFHGGTTIYAEGNTWSAYPLPQEIPIEKDSVLQFDFLLEEDTEDGFQAVCLDEDTEETGSNGVCFVLRSSQGWIRNMVNVPM